MPSDTATPSQECNCLALRQAARHVTQFYDQCLAPAGLRDDAAFDPGEVETLGTADDQRARPRAGHGSNDTGTDHAAAGA